MTSKLEIQFATIHLGEIADLVIYRRADNLNLVKIGFLKRSELSTSLELQHQTLQQLMHQRLGLDAHLTESVENFSDVISQLMKYEIGELRSFDLPFELSLSSPGFAVYQERLQTIPYGTVAGYGNLASAAGYGQVIGQACARNPLPVLLPCHRVVPSDGSLGGGYIGGLDVKRRLLEVENPNLSFS